MDGTVFIWNYFTGVMIGEIYPVPAPSVLFFFNLFDVFT
jgi:hypothetical protein